MLGHEDAVRSGGNQRMRQKRLFDTRDRFRMRGTFLVAIASLLTAACFNDRSDPSSSSTSGGTTPAGGTDSTNSVVGGLGGSTTASAASSGIVSARGGNASAGNNGAEGGIAGAIAGGSTHLPSAGFGGAIGTSTAGTGSGGIVAGGTTSRSAAGAGSGGMAAGGAAGANAGGKPTGGAAGAGSSSDALGGGTIASSSGGAALGGTTAPSSGGAAAGGTIGGFAGGIAGNPSQGGGPSSGGTTGLGGGTAIECTTDPECASKPTTPFCAAGKCVACETGSAAHACVGTLTCCGSKCIDVANDPLNCNSCGHTCILSHATSACSAGKCSVAACAPGYKDCNLDAKDGCEFEGTECACPAGATEPCYSGPVGTNGVGVCHGGLHTCDITGIAWGECRNEVLPSPDYCFNDTDDDCNGVVNDGYPTAATCVCLPGTTTACYDGPAGTAGKGPCRGGMKTCVATGSMYDYCVGQVIPVNEICGNGIDDNCNGTIDEAVDLDGDGWTACGGDCCDTVGAACGSPKLVNPGAIEVPGDSVDNNCNGVVDEDPYPPCSASENFSTDVTTAKALALLNAMEICQIASGGKWGIVSGSPALTRADGTTTPAMDYRQVAVMHQFGSDTSNLPRNGETMASLSSGQARDNNGDPDPTTTMSYTYGMGSPPADFVSAHGGVLPTSGAGCPSGSGANDAVLLRVQLKAPSNANSFSFNFRFFSQEYMNFTCSSYNDFFITMLDSTWLPGPGGVAIPADKNICFDSNGNYISVNTQQFFTVCTPKTGYTCPDGTAGLSNTGYLASNAGATAWLTTTAPVVPGETITLRFVVWDTSDQVLDSMVLIDNFRWSATPSTGPNTNQ
jgi:hypothetical protein